MSKGNKKKYSEILIYQSIKKTSLLLILLLTLVLVPGILQRDLESKESFSSSVERREEWNILLPADVIIFIYHCNPIEKSI